MINNVENMISQLKDIIEWAEWDYILSDKPGFREPEDKRRDKEIIEKAEDAIEALENLIEVL